MQNYFRDKIIIPDLDLQSAVVGYLDTSNSHLLLINNILLTFKMTLYQCRDKHTITFRKVKSNLKSREQIERHIALENNKLDFHIMKWGKITDYMV